MVVKAFISSLLMHKMKGCSRKDLRPCVWVKNQEHRGMERQPMSHDGAKYFGIKIWILILVCSCMLRYRQFDDEEVLQAAYDLAVNRCM